MTTPEDVLEFWFGPDPANPPADKIRSWFQKSPAFDATIRERFFAAWELAVAGRLTEWERSAEGRLAQVIVLDQFSRNLWRDDPRTWAQDERVRGLMRQALAAGDLERLSLPQRSFLLMPLMHSEDLADQDEAVVRFTELRDAGGQDAVQWAVAHRDIVARFGRFPHRNAVLGRATTPEEESFLREPGSSF
jgi:uncharacterized protein (DUF924 family)